MKLEIPYDKDGKLEVELPDERVVAIVEPNSVEIGDETATIINAVENPVGSRSFREFLSDAKDVLFLVNDATRPTPTRRVLDILKDDLAGVSVSFLVATGIHRAPTEDEYLQIFGPEHRESYRHRIFAHDARKDEMVHLGTSQNGTEMEVNKLGVEAHKIVIISSVEPHYFAGYTGGRKSFLPGIASYKTIEQNHKLAVKQEAKSLALVGNPVHEDMIDALKTVKKEVFAINTVLDKNHRIYAAAAGDIHQSFQAAIDKANQVFAAPIPEKADVVVSVVKFPGDIDLYQSQKGIDNAKLALKDGGILILVSKCRDGVGEDAFVKLMGSCDSPRAALEKIEQGYKLGYHKAAKMAEVGLWAETWAVCGVDEETLKKVFIKACGSLQAAIDQALEKKGPSAKVLFMLDGGLIVPFVEKSK